MKAKYPLREAKVEVQEIPGKPGLLQRDRLAAALAAVRGADRLAADGGEHPQEVLIRGRASVARPSPEWEAEAARGGARAAADGSRLPWNPPISRAMGRRPSSSGGTTWAEDGHRAAPRPRTVEAPAGLLDEVLLATRARQGDRSALDRFLAESSPWRALCRWLGLSGISEVPTKAEAKRLLCRDIARIDALLNDQVNAILHRPEFQKLEASWRGLQYLVGKLPKDATVKLRVLNVTWKELEQDLTNALEFDQSQLFRRSTSRSSAIRGASRSASCWATTRSATGGARTTPRTTSRCSSGSPRSPPRPSRRSSRGPTPRSSGSTASRSWNGR